MSAEHAFGNQLGASNHSVQPQDSENDSAHSCPLANISTEVGE